MGIAVHTSVLSIGIYSKRRTLIQTMAKKKKTDTEGKRFLRVRADGAQNIHASDSKFSLDAKPDPYVVFVLDGVTHKCDHVNDVEPLKYFVWPNAEWDFELAPEKNLADSTLVLHVKDSDTIKDRYIGGAAIPLAPLVAAMQDNVLCQSRLFPLEFSDEKLKKKQNSGEVALTVTLVEEHASQDPTKPTALAPQTALPQTAEAAKAPPSARESGPANTSTNESSAPSLGSAPPPQPQGALEVQPTPAAKIESSNDSVPSSSLRFDPGTAASPFPDEKLQRQKTSSTRQLKAIERQPTIPATAPVETVQDALDKHNSPTSTELPALSSSAALLATDPVASAPPLSEARAVVIALTVELVSARNLTRPVSLGAIFDRRPDPMVVLEFCGMSKASVALKDVDLKKLVEWHEVMLAFDLPKRSTAARKGVSLMDLVIHVKDENLMKATYMGGTKVSLEEFFQRQETDEWVGSASAVNGVERTYPLNFSDEKLLKRKQCGELTVRFHFTTETSAPTVVADPTLETASTKLAETSNTGAEESRSNGSEVPSYPAHDNTDQATSTTPGLPPPAQPPIVKDIKLMSVEALCARNLACPSRGANPKGLMKALFDRKPDPYVTFTLGGEQKKCAARKDVDVAFFEWRGAIQVFDITRKPYPKELIVHVRDEDTVGKNPFMAGARIPLHEIWAATLQDMGDAERVAAYALTFADEKLTKQKPCGEITLRFRWVYADQPLPAIEVERANVGSPAIRGGSDSPPVELERSAAQQIEAVSASPAAKRLLGYLMLSCLAITDRDHLIDSSLDLYLVATSFPPSVGRTAKGNISVATSVITNAMKKVPSSTELKAEWKGEEVVFPVIAYDDDADNNFAIELKDKNAITRDTQVAELSLPIHTIISSDSEQHFDMTLDLVLCSAKKASAKSSDHAKQAVQLSLRIQFLQLGSSLLGNALSSGIVLTLFLVKGVLRFQDEEDKQEFTQEAISFGLNVDYLGSQKKRGLMAFGKQDVEAHTDTVCPQPDRAIPWRTCLDVIYSSKQIAAAKDKESLEVEMQLLKVIGKKAPVTIGSTQLNLWQLLNSSISPQVSTISIRFGMSASMDLEYAVAYRSSPEACASRSQPESVGPVSKTVVHIPSGNLHILVIQAHNLVSPHPSEERANELDPEVRMSIEPKYIKRKENPVRSMLKTRPLENAGSTPTWNEYLRLEYRLPPPPVVSADIPVGKALEDGATTGALVHTLPPPILQVGIYDVEIVRSLLLLCGNCDT